MVDVFTAVVRMKPPQPERKLRQQFLQCPDQVDLTDSFDRNTDFIPPS